MAASADALKERERLRLEFAELQALDRSLESLGASVRAFEAHADDLQAVHREAAAKTFADYDLNKNGVIELNELAYLTAETGAPMDAKELGAALKAMNPSGTGKVTADEFSAWFTGTLVAATPRDALTLALLRARLLQHKGDKLVAQIGKRRGVAFPDAKAWDTTDARTHTFSFGVGEFAEAKASMQLRLHHNLVLDADAVDVAPAHHNMCVSVDFKHTGKPDFPSYLRETFRSLSIAGKDQFSSFVSQPKKDVVRLTIAVPVPLPPLPPALNAVNPEPLSRALRVDFEFGTSAADVFGKDKLTVADAIKARTQVHVHLENSLIQSVTSAMQASLAAADAGTRRSAAEFLAGMPFIGALDTSLAISTGDVAEVVQALTEFVRGKFGDQSRQMRDLKPFGMVLPDALAEHSKPLLKMAERADPKLALALSGIRAGALLFQRDVSEITQFAVWTRAGLGVTLELDRVARVADALTALDFFEHFAEKKTAAAAKPK